SNEEAMGKLGSEIFGINGECKVCEGILQVLQSKQPVYDIGTTILRKDGSQVPIMVSAAPLLDAEGNLLGVTTVVRDVTDLRKAMDDAQTKADYLNNIPTPIIAIDNDYTIQYMNIAAAKVVGKDPEEAQGQKCYDLFKADVCNTEKCVCRQALRQDGEFTDDIEISPDPGSLYTRCNASPLKDADGNIVGALEFIRNINREVEITKGVMRLTEAATAGDLSARADADQFIGNYHQIVKSVNNLVDLFVGTIYNTIEYLEPVSRGEVLDRITQEYSGDFNRIREALNSLIDGQNEVTTVAEKIAAGDLMVDVQPRSEEDALMNALARMVSGLRAVVAQVKENADALAGASSQLASAANQAGNASQQVASTSQDIARGANDQSSHLQGSATQVQQLQEAVEQVAQGSHEQSEGIGKAATGVSQVSAAVQQVTQNASSAAENSTKAAETARDGADKTKQTVEGMDRIRVSTEDVADKINTLGQHSEEIGKIVSTIDDIASQTNLLALNAAIEAARAGEHGKGFAVVSDEVRKLAERTASSTQEIGELIKNVQKGVQEAVKAMEQGTNEVRNGYSLANEAGNALSEILSAADNVNEQVSQISAAAQQMTASTDELVNLIDNVGSVAEQNTSAAQQMTVSSQETSKSIESVSSIAEESSASAEELSSAAEEMSSQVQQVVSTADSLKEMADQLQQSVATFRVNGNGRVQEGMKEELAV
ncbi:MAG: methyl-accepting chemotaxis protein, partial [Chloroflexota bacterium]